MLVTNQKTAAATVPERMQPIPNMYISGSLFLIFPTTDLIHLGILKRFCLYSSTSSLSSARIELNDSSLKSSVFCSTNSFNCEKLSSRTFTRVLSVLYIFCWFSLHRAPFPRPDLTQKALSCSKLFWPNDETLRIF